MKIAVLCILGKFQKCCRYFLGTRTIRVALWRAILYYEDEALLFWEQYLGGFFFQSPSCRPVIPKITYTALFNGTRFTRTFEKKKYIYIDNTPGEL